MHSISGLLATALLLGILVFVHEFGHFIVAKACKVKVLKFSIGFGPRVVGFVRGETEYRLGILPLGGYVKMAGELPGETLSDEDASRSFLSQPAWRRALIVVAGPLFNLVFPIAVYFVVFLGSHDAVSTRIGSVEPGLPAASAGLRPGDRILAVDGETTQSFEELRDKLRPRYDKQITLLVGRDGQNFSLQLTPTKTNETTPLETVPRGMIGISPFPRPAVIGVPLSASLHSLDRIISVNGVPVADEIGLANVVRSTSGNLKVEVVRGERLTLASLPQLEPKRLSLEVPRQTGEGYAALGGERPDLYVESIFPGSAAEKAGLKTGDRLLELNGQRLESFFLMTLSLESLKDKPFTLRWRSGVKDTTAQLHQTLLEHKDELGHKASALQLGIIPGGSGALEKSGATPEKVKIHRGFFEALSESARIVPVVIGKTAISIVFLFTGKVPLDSVGGPILLYQLASKSAQQGLDTYLNLMAVISINLGLVNLLPIPVLDGFQLLASIWESIRRRPIPARAREVANMVGLAMLALLMVLVFKNDIMR